MNQIPDSLQNDLDLAIKVLKEAGCQEVYLFGSVASGNARENSDLDLAVRGCPFGMFFGLIGERLCVLNHSVDLINLDWQDDFGKYLESEGYLQRVA